MNNDPVAQFEREYHLKGKFQVIRQNVVDTDSKGHKFQYTEESIVIVPDTTMTEYSRFLNSYLDELENKPTGIEQIAIISNGIHKPARVLLSRPNNKYAEGIHFFVMTVDIERRLKTMLNTPITFTIQPKRCEDEYDV